MARAPMQLVTGQRHNESGAAVPDVALGPWMTVQEILADKSLPFRFQSAKWIRQHVAPRHRCKLGSRVLWRRQHVYEFAAEWERREAERASA